ncbi:hypothetical protein ACQP2T_13900 [Nonomuraea sp. CA-143628]|uniref:hypothetical protein n=1 Tax=Nonomuraea sp. CA-143628 TaxID=3239997 RepID=UPI003D941271
MAHDDISRTIAGFCRELSDGTLEALAAEEGMGEAFRRTRASLATGRAEEGVNADLRALDEPARARFGQGFIPRSSRTVDPLPGARNASGGMALELPAGAVQAGGSGGADPRVSAPTA